MSELYFPIETKKDKSIISCLKNVFSTVICSYYVLINLISSFKSSISYVSTHYSRHILSYN